MVFEFRHIFDGQRLPMETKPLMTGERPTLKIPPKKRALVLPGGGGRGAYQVGVAKALKEKKIEFDFAFGTSIGGLNATMLAQGQLDRLEALWSTMKGSDIFHLPS